ncbi:hypothetical protein I6F11_12910 [Ensifer sp. NBAIM29]|nr:hypothetical protein [Ensifer sp. NBAIM29]
MSDDADSDSNGEIQRQEDLPLERHHLIVEECINKLGGKIRACLRSAYRGLRLSWTLQPIDSEMSLFRAITAEEEAASALMLALKQQRYPGAHKLNPRDHSHKSAISPFLDAVGNMLAGANLPPSKLTVKRGNRPAIHLSFDLGAFVQHTNLRFAQPDNPFNFTLRVEGKPGVYMFEKELLEIATGGGAESIRQHVQNEANLRNRLLYATDEGYPTVVFQNEALLRRRDRVYRLCLLTIGVLQTKQHQLFAAQCLQAFLLMLGKIVDDPIDFTTTKRIEGFYMTIVQQQDGSREMKRGYTMVAGSNIGWEFLATMNAAVKMT